MRRADAPEVAALLVTALGEKYRPALGGEAARAMEAMVLADLERSDVCYVVADSATVVGAARVLLADEPAASGLALLAREVGWPRALRALAVFALLPGGGLGPDEAYLDDLAVAPEARGRGVGAALLAACEREALRSGKTRLSLHVVSDNRPALRLYRRAGYRVARTRRWSVARLVFRAPGAHRMVKDLRPLATAQIAPRAAPGERTPRGRARA